MDETIHIIVADDMEAQRRKLERLISRNPQMKLDGSASSGYEAVLMAGIHRPHIILMDIEMETKTAGIDAAKEINSRLPDIKIIMLTIHDTESIIFSAFQSGIVDYIIKTSSADVITKAIIDAHNNLSPIRPMIAEKMRHEFKRVKENEKMLLYTIRTISTLSQSELQVLRYLYEGKSRKEICTLRFVEETTVKKQINSILKKCNKKNTRDLILTLKNLGIFEVFESFNDLGSF